MIVYTFLRVCARASATSVLLFGTVSIADAVFVTVAVVVGNRVEHD